MASSALLAQKRSATRKQDQYPRPWHDMMTCCGNVDRHVDTNKYKCVADLQKTSAAASISSRWLGWISQFCDSFQRSSEKTLPHSALLQSFEAFLWRTPEIRVILFDFRSTETGKNVLYRFSASLCGLVPRCSSSSLTSRSPTCALYIKPTGYRVRKRSVLQTPQQLSFSHFVLLIKSWAFGVFFSLV